MPQWWRPCTLYCAFLKGSAHIPTQYLQSAQATFPRCTVKLICLWAGNRLLWNDMSAQEHFNFQFKIHFIPLWAWANYYRNVMSSQQLPQLLCGGGCQAWVSSLCAAIHHDHISLWAVGASGLLVADFFLYLFFLLCLYWDFLQRCTAFWQWPFYLF